MLLTVISSIATICAMNQIKSIRSRVGLTQAKFGDCIGCTQSAIGQFERGESDPTIEKAIRIIDMAGSHGLVIQLEHIYGLTPLPAPDAPDAIAGEQAHG